MFTHFYPYSPLPVRDQVRGRRAAGGAERAQAGRRGHRAGPGQLVARAENTDVVLADADADADACAEAAVCATLPAGTAVSATLRAAPGVSDE
ncbi:hypothetical protein [Streptomyces sp. NBC_00344]|uniref:hypothetical protein n=1 Tax=Streptomyces sp. NBC_00344 TaxID=2975720 RepID=UPI002E24E45D